jgi:oligopeptidase B
MEMPVSFRVMAASLAKRGFVVAYAHIRGGGDLGEHWHRAAKLQAKKNTFYDFIACGEALIRKKISHPKKLIIRGGSAGGMLVGASMNMAPELFRMVVAHVPFVDVLNTMLDATLPLTPPEFKEWGNPDSSKEVYDYMKSYCPYTNVEAKSYPILYVTAGLHDPRVTYWEPAKWVAKLRELKKNKNVILFRTNMESGHAGASGRWDLLKELAEEVALEVLACADPG